MPDRLRCGRRLRDLALRGQESHSRRELVRRPRPSHSGGISCVYRSQIPLRSTSAIAASRATRGIDEVFHYGFSGNAAQIARQGLKRGTYATPSGRLSPLQAHIDLALTPNRGLPDVLYRIDLAGLRRAGYEIPPIEQVARSVRYNLPGGGSEILFPYRIPPQFIKLVPFDF